MLELVRNSLFKKQRGFNVLEMVIGLTAVGVIALIAIVMIANSRVKLRDGRRLSDMNQLRQALLLFSERDSERGLLTMDCLKNMPVAVSSCTGSALAGLKDFMPGIQYLNDPLAKTICSAQLNQNLPGQACQPCNYSFVSAEDSGSYAVAFCLEKGTEDFSKGLHYLTENGLR